VFAAVKGACDGGLNVPHKTKRFAGYTTGKGEVQKDKRGRVIETEKSADNFDAKVLRGRIFGNHVTNYMNKLKKDDPAAFKRQFSVWDKTLTENKVKTCEELYKKVHSAIIANPERLKKPGNKTPKRNTVTGGFARVYSDSKGRKWLRHFRMNAQERKDRVAKKFAEAM
jgi:large subunit ribosomal protein L5e